MRPIELLFITANVLTFLVFVVPRLRALRWMRPLVLMALVLALVQIFVEGSRWQMIPAYILTGIFLVVWFVQSFGPMNKVVKRILTSRLTVGCALSLTIISLVLSVALPLILPVFHFPLPSGPYAIGTVTYHWTDISRREAFSPDMHMPRELMVQVWYPARKGSSSSSVPYLSGADAVTAALSRLHHVPALTLQYLKYVTTNASASVPVASDQPNYPVLIYLEGLTGYRQLSTFQIEELVSHGYIVVGLDQPGAAAAVVFPDGHQIAIDKLFPQVESLVVQSLSPAEKAPQLFGQTFKDGIIPYFAQDVSFVLDQLALLNTKDPQGIFTGKLDLAQTGMFGISLGGMVGAEACKSDQRLKACLIMDVAMTADVVQSGLRQPVMWMTRPASTMRLESQENGGWSEDGIEQTQTTMHEVYNSLSGDGYFVQVPGMFHIDFTDLDLLSPLVAIPGIAPGPIGSQRAHDIVNAYSLAFFEKHLKKKPEALLTGPSTHYPEVIFARRGP